MRSTQADVDAPKTRNDQGERRTNASISSFMLANDKADTQEQLNRIDTSAEPGWNEVKTRNRTTNTKGSQHTTDIESM